LLTATPARVLTATPACAVPRRSGRELSRQAVRVSGCAVLGVQTLRVLELRPEGRAVPPSQSHVGLLLVKQGRPASSAGRCHDLEAVSQIRLDLCSRPFDPPAHVGSREQCSRLVDANTAASGPFHGFGCDRHGRRFIATAETALRQERQEVGKEEDIGPRLAKDRDTRLERLPALLIST